MVFFVQVINSVVLVELHRYCEGLLGCEPSMREPICTKIMAFLGIIIHHAIVEMIRNNHHEVFADIWYILLCNKQRQDKYENVSIIYPS